jgi:hypothetical protein
MFDQKQSKKYQSHDDVRAQRAQRHQRKARVAQVRELEAVGEHLPRGRYNGWLPTPVDLLT